MADKLKEMIEKDDTSKTETDVTNSDRFKNGLCYIPFVWIVLLFTENQKSPMLMKHIKYATFLLFVYLFLNFIFVWLFTIRWVWWFLFVIYAWITGFLWYKAYNWEEVQLDYVDDFEQKVKDKMNDNTPVDSKQETKTTTVKTDDKNKSDIDKDILDF